MAMRTGQYVIERFAAELDKALAAAGVASAPVRHELDFMALRARFDYTIDGRQACFTISREALRMLDDADLPDTPYALIAYGAERFEALREERMRAALRPWVDEAVSSALRLQRERKALSKLP